MIGLDDERSKEIAEVIGNRTCKKIVVYLAEVKNASEKDISDKLEIPINTVEYNLNKLMKAGMIEKTKHFFWSVKGKKIDMYRLSNKKIVISPKSKPNMVQLKSVIPVILISVFLIAVAGLFLYYNNLGDNIIKNQTFSEEKLLQFSSLDDLKNFLKANIKETSSGIMEDGSFGVINKMASNGVPAGAGTSSESASRDSASSYSSTNVQVEGVDEADIVKNDGKYIYAISGKKVVIVNAYPADKMEVLSSINFSSPRNIFINKDKLVVFEDSYRYIPYEEGVLTKCAGYRCGGSSEYLTRVYIYNINNRKNPILEKNISFDGSYSESRMIGDYIYTISSKYVYNYDVVMPMYEVDGVRSSIAIQDMHYFDYSDNSYVFNTIGAINLNDYSLNNKVYLTAGSGQIYVSESNIYLTYTKTISYKDRASFFAEEVAFKILLDVEKSKVEKILKENTYYDRLAQIRNIILTYSLGLSGTEKEEFDNRYVDLNKDFEENLNKRIERTAIHKISIDKNKISYKVAGEVPGHILNQFSMDEFNDYFRIATTTGNVWSGNSLNNVYVLDKNLEIVGRLEDLAKGEKIYSARFVGNRAYVVTFKKVDPLFVIDLKNPKNPKVLVYLKIPGYSDYLHPYDENHVIGIGKDAVDASSEQANARNLDFAWYQGVKISLFDITDVEHPVEKAKFTIGDRGSDSPVLSDHKALLFDREKKLLVIPVSVAEIDRSKYRACSDEELNDYNSYNYCLRPNTYGEIVWQGAYVLNIDLNEINLRGKISHFENKTFVKHGPAKDEVIGAVRVDEYDNVWTKVAIINNSYYQSGQWKTNATDYNSSVYGDYNIDTMPGGINYHYYYWNYQSQIQRSLFMDDVLYTVSQEKVKANNLNDLNEISFVKLGYSQDYYGEIFY